MNKQVIIAIVAATVLIIGAVILSKGNSSGGDDIPLNNVSIENGVQIVEIYAKAGYRPRASTAKAGIPTIIRFNTRGTFDCSAAVRIPSLGISEFLPQSGTKDIAINTPQAGTLNGSCGMGMYPFEINFQS